MKSKKNKKIKNYSESEFYFDDCLICQAMKSSEKEGRSLSTYELKESFKLQNQKNKINNKKQNS